MHIIRYMSVYFWPSGDFRVDLVWAWGGLRSPGKHLALRPALSRAEGLSGGSGGSGSDLTEVKGPRLERGSRMNTAPLISEAG